MTPARTVTRLMRLYPAGWRARYGDELQTLILDMSGPERIPWRVRADVARAGGCERLRAAGLDGDRSPEARARGGAALVLWAWALFMVAGAILQKTSEHWRQALPAGGHAPASAAFDALIVVAVVTGVVVLAGIALTLPMLVSFLRGGGWPQIRRRVMAAAVLTAVFLAASIGLVAWAHGLSPRARQGHDTGYGIVALAWALLGAATLCAWTGAATRTAARLGLRADTLRIEARLAIAVAAAMAVMATATAIWWVAVGSVSPSALTGSPGGHGSALVPSLAVAMALMLAGLALGVAGARRARGALGGLDGAAPA